MSNELVHDAWKRQQAVIDAIRKVKPEMVERLALPDQNMVLGRIGVTFLPTNRPKGYLRLYPQDFIVEEVMKDGRVTQLLAEEAFQDADDKRTLWADVIKANISHPHAMTDLQSLLGTDLGQIGYSGIKDAIAVTCQRMSMRGVRREQVEALQHPHLLVRPVAYGSGALQPGDLQGNRFTLVVRTETDDAIDEVMERIRANGFSNFFGAQRFGTRLISHRLGQKLLQGDVDGALRMYFCEPGPYDVPLFRDVREAFTNLYGDWDEMMKIAKQLPYSLHQEIMVLEQLQKDPLKTRLALGQIRDQVKLWIYAYGSWLVNRYLSRAVEQGLDVPDEIPLPLSTKGPRAEYREFMINDGTMNYLQGLQAFPYVQASDKTLPTKMVPGGLTWVQIPGGWVLRFSLGKGAYATSFLSHAFQLYEGLPVPEWVQGDEVDSFEKIGDGSFASIKEKFADVLTRRDLVKEESEDEAA